MSPSLNRPINAIEISRSMFHSPKKRHRGIRSTTSSFITRPLQRGPDEGSLPPLIEICLQRAGTGTETAGRSVLTLSYLWCLFPLLSQKDVPVPSLNANSWSPKSPNKPFLVLNGLGSGRRNKTATCPPPSPATRQHFANPWHRRLLTDGRCLRQHLLSDAQRPTQSFGCAVPSGRVSYDGFCRWLVFPQLTASKQIRHVYLLMVSKRSSVWPSGPCIRLTGTKWPFTVPASQGQLKVSLPNELINRHVNVR